MTGSPKCVLVVDNDSDVLDAVLYNLTLAGYKVLTADSAERAYELLAKEIIHLAVIDVRLEYNDRPDDLSGFELAKALPPYIPCVIFTAYEDKESIRMALGEVKAKEILDKNRSDAAAGLVNIVNRVFSSYVKVNFQLQIEGPLQLTEMAAQIDVPVLDPVLRPTDADVRQVFQILFHDADIVYIDFLLSSKPAPSPTQSGSVLVRVRPRFDYSLGAPVVVKLGVGDEIEQEAKNYRRIKRYLGGQRLPILDSEDGLAYVRQIGGLRYSLINTEDNIEDWEAIHVFGKIFLEKNTATVINLLERFFRQTFRSLFKDARWEQINLTVAYTKGLRLTPEKLRTAVAKLHPGIQSEPQIRFKGLRGAFLNPIMWALPNGEFRRFDVTTRVCLCHGDLHSRNILVDEGGHFWLIDFARVEESHALRDFAELETDIKFNLLREVDLEKLLSFERALLAPNHFQDSSPNVSFGNGWLDHTYQIVSSLRQIASELTDLQGDMREYYQALFFHTLNIIRLNHISVEKKEHALLSAALLAQRLGNWPMWEYPPLSISVATSTSSSPLVAEPEEPGPKPLDLNHAGKDQHGPLSRLLVVSIFLLLGVGLVALLWWAMRFFNPSWQQVVAAPIILSVLIIPAFGMVGLVKGETVVKVLQDIVISLLGKNGQKKSDKSDDDGKGKT